MTVRILALAIAAVVTTGAAHAQSTDDAPRTALVHFDDLNLNSTAGKAALDRRIAQAAAGVCTSDGVDGLSAKAKSAACVKAAIDQAKSASRLKAAPTYAAR